jgi:TMEM175 potassium channel family protein
VPVKLIDPKRSETVSSGGLTKSRIEALCDGVFAIAMTLMVFNLKVPAVAIAAGSTDLADALFALWPQFLSYAISFVMLGVFWIGHHNQFHYIRRTDRVLLWINIAFLMFVTAIPFSTQVLGQYRSQPAAVVFYAVNLVLVGFLLYGQWWYATVNRHLVDADLDPTFTKLVGNRILLGCLLLLLSITMSLISTRLSLLVFSAIAIFYIIPGRVDRYWAARK